MLGSLLVLVWWFAFAGGHLVLSSLDVRQPIIARLGARGFQALYSLIALGTFVMLVRTYWHHKHVGPLLWSLTTQRGWWLLAILLAGLGIVIAVLAFARPSPTAMVAGGQGEARGMMRITRHPLFTGIGLWGLGHTLANGYLSDVIFFGGFLVFSLVGAAHQDARKRATESERLGAFYAETSLLPFMAILSRRNRLVLAEIPRIPAIVGVVVAVVLFVFHRPLFG
jgi:uncharacterized membrane protein